jgi:hypothetical protein
VVGYLATVKMTDGQGPEIDRKSTSVVADIKAAFIADLDRSLCVGYKGSRAPEL